MVVLREPLSSRLRWFWVVLAALLAIGGALFVTRSGDATAAAYCRAEYARAGTAADSALVDAQLPAFQRRDATARLTCGALRRSHRL